MRSWTVLGVCGLAGCFSSPQGGAGVQSQVGQGGCFGANCHRGSPGGSGGGSGSSGATSQGASSGGAGSRTNNSGGTAGGSGGSSSGSATSTAAADAGVDCPDLYVASTVSDDASGAPLAGATITAVGVDGVPLPAAEVSSQSDGTFAVCVPAGVTFSLQITDQGYPKSVLEDLSLSHSETLSLAHGGIPVISSQDLQAFGASLGYDAQMGVLLIQVLSVSDQPACHDASGWQLSLAFPDGGSLPDGGDLPFARAYLDPSYLPDQTLQATSSIGEALFYDVDPSLTGRVVIQAVNAGADAGACPIVDGELGFQGTAVIAAQVLTFGPVMVP